MSKFVIGFVIGTAIGAGVAVLLAAEPGQDDGLVARVQSNVRHVIQAAKRATSEREQELWKDYHARVKQHAQ